MAFKEADCTLDDMDAIAATAGPGLIGGLLIGLTTGKALALAAQKPLSGSIIWRAMHFRHASLSRLNFLICYCWFLVAIANC